MKVVDLADEIIRQLENPTDLSLPQIVYWLLNNIGKLNILIDKEIIVVDNEFSPELTVEQANIYKQLYLIKWVDSKITNSLGASSYDWSEITEGDTTIRRVSKNEIAKTFKTLRNSYGEELNDLVYFYKKNQVLPGSYEINILPTGYCYS